MSEYVVVESEATDHPNIMELYVNQTLTYDERETYLTFADGEVGSPIAQMLFSAVDGIESLEIYPDYLRITRDSSAAWEQLIDDVRDALRDFFL